MAARRPGPGCVRDRPRSTDQEQDLTPVHPPAPGARAAGVGLRGKVRAPCCSRAAGPCEGSRDPRASETRHAQTLASRDWHIQHTLYTVYIHRAQTSVLTSDHRQCSEFSRHTQTGTQIHTLPARRAERVPRVLYNELTKYIVIRHI